MTTVTKPRELRMTPLSVPGDYAIHRIFTHPTCLKSLLPVTSSDLRSLAKSRGEAGGQASQPTGAERLGPGPLRFLLEYMHRRV